MKDRGAQFNGTTWRRPHQLLRDPARHRREPRVRHPARGRPPGQQLDQGRGPRHRDDRGPQRVRDRARTRPQRVLTQRMMAVAYEWHNYGKSTIGNRTDIERVPIDNLQAFYQKYYQPDNAVLVVAGKFDEKKALDFIAKYFGALPKPDRKLPRDLHRGARPGRRADRHAAPRRRRRPGRRCSTTSPPARTPSSPRSRSWPSILDSEPSGRLYKALVETKKASSVSASAHALRTTRARSRSWPRSTPRTGGAREGPRHDALGPRRRGAIGRHPGGGRSRPPADPQGPRAGGRRPQPDRHPAERVGRAGRLAALLPRPRPASRRSRPRRSRRSPRST